VMKRFREGFHQEPGSTDLEYSARVCGFESVEEFVRSHHEQPWLVSMVGFVAGLPFLYQLTGREKQLEVPKYLSPRSGMTPELTLGHGGCFGSQYSVEGAGGYQMLGLLVGPIFDPTQQAPDFSESMFFYRPGDIVKYRSIEETEYRELRKQVEAGTFRYKTVPIDFDSQAALTDLESYNRTLVEALNGN
jgi:urea carboxylase